jgi:hypothetical protein
MSRLCYFSHSLLQVLLRDDIARLIGERQVPLYASLFSFCALLHVSLSFRWFFLASSTDDIWGPSYRPPLPLFNRCVLSGPIRSIGVRISPPPARRRPMAHPRFQPPLLQRRLRNPRRRPRLPSACLDGLAMFL